jgi:hypothetical protein
MSFHAFLPAIPVSLPVFPAQAGIQSSQIILHFSQFYLVWIPAYAGMTKPVLVKTVKVIKSKTSIIICIKYLNSNELDDCGCFGGLWKRTIPEAIVEEVIFLILWAVYFVIQYRNKEAKKQRVGVYV